MKQKNLFHDEQHLKAWLMRVTANQCKSISRSFWRKYRTDEQYLYTIAAEDKQNTNFLYAIFQLPKSSITSTCIIMRYMLDEIAKIMQRNASTIRSKTARAKNLLKKQLEKEERICSQKMNEDYLNKLK